MIAGLVVVLSTCSETAGLLSAKVLFTTKEGIKAVLQFLKKTKVETRKWLLGESEETEN